MAAALLRLLPLAAAAVRRCRYELTIDAEPRALMVDAAKAIGTPLQCAMGLGGSPEMIETLIDAGAKDPSFRGFLVACEIGSKATMAAYHDKMVVKHPKAPWLSHHYAARFGATPLHVVAGMSDTAGQREKVEWLLEKSGDAALQKQWWWRGRGAAQRATLLVFCFGRRGVVHGLGGLLVLGGFRFEVNLAESFLVNGAYFMFDQIFSRHTSATLTEEQLSLEPLMSISWFSENQRETSR